MFDCEAASGGPVSTGTLADARIPMNAFGSIFEAAPRILYWYSSLTRAKALASCQYRIGNFVEVGQRAKVIIAERLPLGVLEQVDVLIVVRPYPSRAVHRALSEAQRLSVLRVADYDDLLFAGAPSERPEVQSGRLSLRWMEGAHRAHASLLPFFDAFSVTTAELAEELRVVRPDAQIIIAKNGLSPSWVAQGRALYSPWKPGEWRTMRFFPGSPTHDASFLEITPALAEWMAMHDDVELEVVGNLKWSVDRFPKGRARHRSPVSYAELPGLLASTWVNLWPRTETRFNRAKSPIKFLEAAAFGAPTIASSACHRSGLECDGIRYANTPNDWIDALTHWRCDDDRMHASRAAMSFADAQGGAAEGWRALRDGLRRILGGP